MDAWVRFSAQSQARDRLCRCGRGTGAGPADPRAAKSVQLRGSGRVNSGFGAARARGAAGAGRALIRFCPGKDGETEAREGQRETLRAAASTKDPHGPRWAAVQRGCWPRRAVASDRTLSRAEDRFQVSLSRSLLSPGARLRPAFQSQFLPKGLESSYFTSKEG